MRVFHPSGACPCWRVLQYLESRLLTYPGTCGGLLDPSKRVSAFLGMDSPGRWLSCALRRSGRVAEGGALLRR